MISRVALTRSVCLRCQFRLLDRPKAHSLLRAPLFRSQSLPRRQHSSTSQSAWDRLESDSRTENKKKGDNGDGFASPIFESHPTSAEQDAAPSRIEPEQGVVNETEPAQPSTEAAPVKMTKYGARERRDHTRIGKRHVYLEHEHLKVKMLGEKARAVVMRDERHQKVYTPLPIEMLPHEKFDLFAALEAEKKEYEEGDTLKNLDDVRPSDPIVTEKEFDALFNVLLKGFTMAQLKDYLNTVIRKPREASGFKDAEYDWLEDKVPWSPVQKIQVLGSPKERLVITLLKDVWHMELREMVDGMGIFTAQVNERFLALLKRDNKRLGAIRATYLDRSDKIDISSTRLTIFATKARTDTVLMRLDEAAQDMTTEDVQVEWIRGSAVDAALLVHLGELTNTFVTFDKAQKKISVSWFENKAINTKERLSHVVERLLYTALQPRDASVTLNYDSKDAEGRLIPAVRGREMLSWKNKLTQWYRWVSPTGRVAPSESDASLRLEKLLPRPIQARPVDSNESWSKPYHSTKASFGQILHKGRSDFSLETAAKNANHIFSAISPPPASLAALSETITSSEPVTTSFILTFRPHPATSSKTARSLPGLLELHLAIPDDLPEGPLIWDACSKRLVATLGENHTDVGRPSEPVDLRLSQPLQTTMSPASLDASAFREYIETAELDLLAGHLAPPPEISVTGLPSANTGKAKSTPARYLFSGLEMHRTLDIEYEGHLLKYTSIQAGHHGGRRAEMVLEATPVDASLSEREQAAHTERYLALVQDLAQGKIVKWVGDVLSDNPRDEVVIAAGDKAGIVTADDVGAVASDEADVFSVDEADIFGTDEAHLFGTDEVDVFGTDEADMIVNDEADIFATDEADVLANDEADIEETEDPVRKAEAQESDAGRSLAGRMDGKGHADKEQAR